MGSKKARRLGSFTEEIEPEKVNKFDDFLRRSMNYRSLKKFGRNYTEDSAL
ncbi:MAG: hypothetical protein KDD45_12585 [Bdellovibrionales bacterium]|nr:hypothetical protein [Bdellovibrionales bacterium]